MLQFIWNEVLFRPLLNLLIGLYNTIGLENLGLAIIALTVLTRLLLLPISLQDKRKQERIAQLQEQLKALEKSYANNPSVLREEQRKLFREYRFRRWPKVLTLSIQALILVVLYQVFVGGIHLEEVVDALYSFVDVPLRIQTIFLGIDIAEPSLILSLIAGLYLFGEIVYGHYQTKSSWNSGELLYAIGLPGVSFLILWYLPAVKALFIISSMLFTTILSMLRAFFAGVKYQQELIDDQAKADLEQRTTGIPHPKDRFN